MKGFGVFLMIVGAILVFTGVGAIAGVPVALIGLYMLRAGRTAQDHPTGCMLGIIVIIIIILIFTYVASQIAHG